MKNFDLELALRREEKMSEEAKNIQTDVIGSKGINPHKDNFQGLINELNKLDTNYFNFVLGVVLKDKQKYPRKMKPIDFLLDWKYEVVKILCTQKLELKKGNNQALIDKFKDLDCKNNKSELMKVLQNLKVAEETQKIILDDFVDQNGFKSLDLKPFEEIEEKYDTQANNRDENKTIFLPMSNDFIKLCKVIWRIIKNTETKRKLALAQNSYNYEHLECHMNCVFNSNANKAFFDALHSFNDAWDKKLIIDKFKTDKFESEEDKQETFIYQQENDIYAYFGNLSRIKCIDAEYTEFANRLDLPCLDRKVVISTNFERIYATDMYVGRKCNSHPNNENTMQQPIIGIPERRETCGSKIKRFALGLLNGLAKNGVVCQRERKKLYRVRWFLFFLCFGY